MNGNGHVSTLLWYVYNYDVVDALTKEGFTAQGPHEFSPADWDVAIAYGTGDGYAQGEAPKDSDFAYRHGARSVKIVPILVQPGHTLEQEIKDGIWTKEYLLLAYDDQPVRAYDPKQDPDSFESQDHEPLSEPNSVQSGHSVQQIEWKNLRLDVLPDPAEFPLDVFPPTVKRLVEGVAKSIGCPIDFPAAVALAVASVAIGQSCRLKLKNGYFTSASIWLAMIGPPSDGKSPSLEHIAQPIRDIDKRLKDEYLDKLVRWEQECIDARKSKSPAPPKPPHTRIDVDDVTIEALTRIMNDSPHGVGWFCDEISGMILGLNMYKPGGRGNDRHTLNKWWSNKRSKRDRLNESGNAEWPFLTVAGGLVPDCLPDLRDRDGRATGFLERWLIVFPPSQPIPEWSWSGFDEELVKEWDDIVNRLHNRSSEQEKQTIIDWKDDEARATWVRCYNAHVAEMNAIDFRDSLRGSWGKFREYAGRFCLVLSRLWRESNTDTLRDMSIDSPTIVRAWALVDYFKVGFLRAKRAIEGIGSGGGEDVNAILRWIMRERLTKFSERDLYREVGRFRKEKEAMESALAWLQSRCAIRPVPLAKAGPGRNPSPQWEVNPDLINIGQNGHNGQNLPREPGSDDDKDS